MDRSDDDSDPPEPDVSTQRADLEARLDAVERALTDSDATIADLGDAAAVDSRLADLEDEVTTLLARVDELDAATQAVRGYAGGISAVNEAVERRADLALATVERLERRLDPEPGLTVERLADEGVSGAAANTDEKHDGDIGTSPTGAQEPQADEEMEKTLDDAGRSFATRLRDAL